MSPSVAAREGAETLSRLTTRRSSAVHSRKREEFMQIT
jgi:hypothetical protein